MSSFSDAHKFKIFDWDPIPFDEIEATTNDNGSRVYHTPEGDMPSMTTMLGLLDDGGIDEWKKAVGEEVATKVVTDAVNRGNSLHDISERYLKNELIPSELSGKGKVLFNRSKKYLNDITKVRAIEIPLYNRIDRYAGRVDCVADMKFPDGIERTAIIDHKNSRRPIVLSKPYARRKLFGYMLQCCGYRRCIQVMYGLDIKKGVLIVGNHETSSSSRFIFDLDPFDKELDIVIDAFHNGQDIKRSKFFQL